MVTTLGWTLARAGGGLTRGALLAITMFGVFTYVAHGVDFPG